MIKKYNITVNGNQYAVEVEEVKSDVSHVAPAATQSAAPVSVPAPKPSAPAATPQQSTSSTGKKIIAPMPASIISLAVNVGDTVAAGQVLLVFESMKMQNDLTTPVGGVVAAINTSVGSFVSVGDVLVVIE